MAREKDRSTVFVRSVPFGVDEKGLEEVFSELGPIKQCFLVKPKGSEKHKGFGFVHYALPEDAERAAQELNGRLLEGRKLQVRWGAQQLSRRLQLQTPRSCTQQGAHQVAHAQLTGQRPRTQRCTIMTLKHSCRRQYCYHNCCATVAVISSQPAMPQTAQAPVVPMA